MTAVKSSIIIKYVLGNPEEIYHFSLDQLLSFSDPALFQYSRARILNFMLFSLKKNQVIDSIYILMKCEELWPKSVWSHYTAIIKLDFNQIGFTWRTPAEQVYIFLAKTAPMINLRFWIYTYRKLFTTIAFLC